jgi:hypothetical protein
VLAHDRVGADCGVQMTALEGGAAVYVLNLMHYRPARHRPVTLAASSGAAVCFLADVIVSRGTWDRVAVIRYTTRSIFADMVSRRGFKDRRVHGEADMDQTIVMRTLPGGQLPGQVRPSDVLLELWTGPAPGPVAEGPATVFDVEPAIAGDGRRWTGARYTSISPGTPLPLRPHQRGYEALLLAPASERWQ